MRIGFASVYSWRPHVEHLYYLAGLAQEGGNSAFFLTCDSDLSACYSRDLRPSLPAWLHCAACRTGGFKSYTRGNTVSIGQLDPNSNEAPADSENWASSSAATLGRFETDAELASGEFRRIVSRLSPSVRAAYSATLRWIDRYKLDAICLFNGRMDVTRAVMEAARYCRLPFVTTERTWFADGLHLTPNDNCLGLEASDEIIQTWREMPLTRSQSIRAAQHSASRFLRTNTKEWRAYNVKARAVNWPISGGRYKILLTPGSRSESWGHPELGIYWPERSGAYDAVIDHLGLRPNDLVLRCHPVWGENIGAKDGSSSEHYYTEWAKRRGIHVIPSNDPASTLGLIEQADAIVVCGGSAALEAGTLGKQVIGVGPSTYQRAGFQSQAYTPAELHGLRLNADLSASALAAEAQRIRRMTLRFCYNIVYRAAQYVPQVQAISTTQYLYFEGGSPDRLTNLLRSGKLSADDAEHSLSAEDEDEILGLIERRNWGQILDLHVETSELSARPVKRRLLYRPVDKLREMLPRGDV